MSSKSAFNVGFLLLILGTISLSFYDHVGGVGTGFIVFIMTMVYANESAPRD